jgi:nucleotide-binding universal stress UspA family protein
MKTTKISKVLIALDYDPTSQKIAEYGYNFAKALHAEVTLVHVVLDPIFYTTNIEFTRLDSVKADSVEGLTSASHFFLDSIKTYLQDDSITTIIREGEVAKTISKVAKEIDADIIVMGSHSKRWLEEILLGHATEAVLKYSKIPIIIIPTKKHL